MIMARLVLHHEPPLQAPSLILGFAGWANAAGLSVEVVSQMQSLLSTDAIGTLETPECYVITNPSLANRPITTIRGGLVEKLRLPTTEVHALYGAQSQPELLLIEGVEPDLQWQEYVEALWSLIARYSVKRVYTIGSYYDQIPHTRPPHVTAVVSDLRLKGELRSQHVDFTSYEGPTSIQTYILHTCQQRQVEGVSLWGGVPPYLQGSYPKGVVRMLSILSKLIGFSIDSGALQSWVTEFEGALQQQVAKNEELQGFISQLEAAYDQSMTDTDVQHGDEIVEEIQQFLRQRQRPGNAPPSTDQP
jgi:proteasome assembly chaperone (PAC2) family protein